jgi:hypothetical protein
MIFILVLLLCNNSGNRSIYVDWAEVLKATGCEWRYLLFQYKEHVTKTRPREIWEEFQEGSSYWSYLAPPYWQVCLCMFNHVIHPFSHACTMYTWYST